VVLHPLQDDNNKLAVDHHHRHHKDKDNENVKKEFFLSIDGKKRQ